MKRQISRGGEVRRGPKNLVIYTYICRYTNTLNTYIYIHTHVYIYIYVLMYLLERSKVKSFFFLISKAYRLISAE